MKIIKEAEYCQEADLNTDKVVHEALYEDEASMEEVEDSENKRIEFDIPYEAYNVLTQYWYGQGDPLYAVLSRSSGDKVIANDAELSRLISATEEALEGMESHDDHNATPEGEDEYMALTQFLSDANAAYTKLTGYSEEPQQEVPEVSYSLRGHFGEAVEHDDMSGMDDIKGKVKKALSDINQFNDVFTEFGREMSKRGVPLNHMLNKINSIVQGFEIDSPLDLARNGWLRHKSEMAYPSKLIPRMRNESVSVEPWYCKRCKEMVYDSECPYCGAKASYPMEEANKSGKSEHSGPKKGKGAYFGKKKDAKKESNKVRREDDKKEVVKEDYAPGMYDSVDDIVKKYVAQVRNNFSQDQNILSIMETAIVDGYNLGLDEARKVADEDDSVSMPMPQTDDADQSYTFNPFSRKSRKQ